VAIEEQIRANAEFVVEKLHEISDAENLNCGWPASNRNGVRHRVGTPGRHESEPSGDHCASSVNW
jgi:hypothetical protein